MLESLSLAATEKKSHNNDDRSFPRRVTSAGITWLGGVVDSFVLGGSFHTECVGEESERSVKVKKR